MYSDGRGVAQLASALASGARGRGFKSHHPDHLNISHLTSRQSGGGARGRGFPGRLLTQSAGQANPTSPTNQQIINII